MPSPGWGASAACATSNLLLPTPAVTPSGQANTSACTSVPPPDTGKPYLPPSASSLVLSQHITALPVPHSALKQEVGAACARHSHGGRQELISRAGTAGLTVPGAAWVTHNFFHAFIQTWMPGQELGGFPALRNEE